jgi:hypothetical protein
MYRSVLVDVDAKANGYVLVCDGYLIEVVFYPDDPAESQWLVWYKELPRGYFRSNQPWSL